MTEQAAPRYLTVLSDYICRTKLEDLPREVVDRARWLIAEVLPLTAVGMQVGEMRELAKRQLANEPKGHASVMGYGVKTAPNVAALLNGTAGTYLEFVEENIHAKGMPSIQVVPAAIAMAEEHGASGADLLLAVILGYEAAGRIARATKTKLALHPSGTSGVISAAVAAGKLAGLGTEVMRHLINVSATLGLATSRQAIIQGATVGRVYSGASGYMGLLALDMVQAGLTGEADGVGSVYGVIYADTPDVVSRIPQFTGKSFDPDLVVADLGSDFLMMKGFVKMHACARSIHPALDLIEDVMAKSPGGRIEPAQVERIDYRAYFSPTTLFNKNPATPFGSKFSLPFAVASLLYHGRGQLTNFDDKAFANPVIRDLAQRVNISEDPDYTARFPEQQPCDVKVRLKDGRVVEAKADYTRGDPHNPRTAAELEAKFYDVSKQVWDETHARKLLEGIMAIERVDDVRAFFLKHPV